MRSRTRTIVSPRPKSPSHLSTLWCRIHQVRSRCKCKNLSQPRLANLNPNGNHVWRNRLKKCKNISVPHRKDMNATTKSIFERMTRLSISVITYCSTQRRTTKRISDTSSHWFSWGCTALKMPMTIKNRIHRSREQEYLKCFKIVSCSRTKMTDHCRITRRFPTNR